MRRLLFVFLLLATAGLVFGSCGKKVYPPETNEGWLQGGKGGDYNVVVVPKEGIYTRAARVFIKYAADKAPADTTQYDERENTMIEPGFGPHVHFSKLKQGTYYIYAETPQALQGDTVLVLSDSTPKDLEVKLQLH
jgi:hypothetical protein